MTLAEIVQFSKQAGTEEILLQQIELTDSVFQMTTQTLLFLLEQGVSTRVIRAMQESPFSAREKSARIRAYGER